LREVINQRHQTINQTRQELSEAKEEIKEYKQHIQQQNQEIIQLRTENNQILHQLSYRGAITLKDHYNDHHRKNEKMKMVITRYSNGKKSKHHNRSTTAKAQFRSQRGIHRLTYNNKRRI